jgi:hypothetical protein
VGVCNGNSDHARKEHGHHGQQATSRAALQQGDPVTGQRPGPGWWQGTDGRWYPPQPQQWGSIPPGRPGSPRKEADAREENRDNSSYVESMKSLQELLKTLRAFMTAHKIISGVGITIVIVVAIGAIHPTPSITSKPYPAVVQQGWLNDCESLSFNTIPKCECELTYFENRVTAQQFEQDYSAMPPGVVPPELAGAEACPT